MLVTIISIDEVRKRDFVLPLLHQLFLLASTLLVKNKNDL